MFLSVAETAMALGVSTRTVWRLIADKRLPVVRPGRSVRVPRAALKAMEKAAMATSGSINGASLADSA